MQVGASSTTGHAECADRLALLEMLADMDRHDREMGVDRVDAVAMVDHHGGAGEELIGIGQGDDPVGRRQDRRARRRGDVDAEMRCHRLAVEHALAAMTPLIRPVTGQRNFSSQPGSSLSAARAAATRWASDLMRARISGLGRTDCSGSPSMRSI